jgi:hypothetical protein
MTRFIVVVCSPSILVQLGGLKGGSVFTNGLGCDRFYLWKSKGEHPDSLMRFIHDVGVPHTLLSDNAKEEMAGRAKDTCTKYRINVKTTVPNSPWHNLAEASIRKLKKSVRGTIRRTGTSLFVALLYGMVCCSPKTHR